jgi:hypothetical protein
MTRLRAVPRGTVLLTVGIVAVFAAAASNVPNTLQAGRWRQHDRRAFDDWARTHGGRKAYGIAIPEGHKRYDVVCAAHFRGAHRRSGADYRIFLLVDSHRSGKARVLRVVRGPVKVRPTKTAKRCGRPPPAP